MELGFKGIIFAEFVLGDLIEVFFAIFKIP
jgi:hypothetical protein